MLQLLAKLSERFPELQYAAGEQFCWSPESGEIVYKQSADGQHAIWSLLHETGHALLCHQSYGADFELLQMEIAAWERARLLAADFTVEIDEDHIQDCLDTYRDWLYQRSLCPNCGAQCMQEADFQHYRCYNCHAVWRVSRSRFARTYRSRKSGLPATIFHLQQ